MHGLCQPRPHGGAHLPLPECLPVLAKAFWKRWVTSLMHFSLMASCKSFIFRRSACSTASKFLEAAFGAQTHMDRYTAGSTLKHCQPTFT